MASMSMRQMLEAGVHFGHQTRFWNPKMAPFIFGDRNRIHIINLETTLPLYAEAAGFVKSLVADGGKVLFVGTKRSARDAIAKEAVRCGMPYVSHRWLGGMLTNFKTIRQSIRRLGEIDEMLQGGLVEGRSKREAQTLRREREKLDRSLGGIREMDGLPDALFVVDVGHERIAVHEAQKLGIPVVAVVDTNCSPDGISYVIPGNDDAMRAIQLYAAGIADAVIEGRATIPEVAVGEDEFVELDEEGKPRPKGAARRRAAPVRKKAPARRRATAAVAPAESDAAAAEAAAAELVEADPEESPEAFMARRAAARKKAPAAAAKPDAVAPPAGDAAEPRARRRPGCRGRRGRDAGRGIMTVTAEAVKALRERTGAGMMECKKALVETGGDLEAAAEIMRKSGLAKADKKAGRVAAEGVIAIERARDGHSAAVVEVNSETDFVAREADFRAFAAAVAQAALAARPRDLADLATVRLPSGQTVEETRRALVARIGENISVRRFEMLESSGALGTYLHGTRIGVAGGSRGWRRRARSRPGDARGGHQSRRSSLPTTYPPNSLRRSGRSSWRRSRATRRRRANRPRSSRRWSTARSASTWARSRWSGSRSSRTTSSPWVTC